MSYYISPLRLIAGVVFILAGLILYYGLETILALPIILIVAGGALVLTVVTGRRPRGGDVALLVIALVVFDLTASGPSLNWSGETATYSASRSEVAVNRLTLKADAGFGGVQIMF